MSDNQDALRLADEIERDYHDETLAPRMAAAELRRLHAENEALREANEAFGKRQEWWNDKMVRLEAINAELVEALKQTTGAHESGLLMSARGLDKARAALAKAGKSK